MTQQRLIDVRQYPEFASGHISGSELVPLQDLERSAKGWDRSQSIVLVCRSGRRADQAASILRRMGFEQCDVLEGGIEAWKAAGKPLQKLDHKPWSLERQVRLGAGSLVLLTMALAFAISRYFFLGTAIVGAGLCFAGISDICMMASLLGRMPWNRASGRSV